MASHCPEDSELTKLRFDKQALENKLRKFAVHCQRLEDEKENILQALGLTKSDDDIGKAVVTLCDKVASLEKECDSLAKSENRSSAALVESDQLREKISSLQTQVSDYQKKIDRLVRSEAKNKELVASLKREQQELRGLADRARGNVESLESEKCGQLRYLEQENLQLMVDLKATKKQLQHAKSEINMLRAQGAAPVAGISDLPKPKHAPRDTENRSSTNRSRNTPGAKHPKTPADKENSKNQSENPTSSTRHNKSSSRRTQGAVGLGEAFAATEENTQECKQS